MTDPLDLARPPERPNLDLTQRQNDELNHYRHLANGRGIVIDQLERELTRLRAVEKAAREYQHSVASGDRDFPDGLYNYDRASYALSAALRGEK